MSLKVGVKEEFQHVNYFPLLPPNHSKNSIKLSGHAADLVGFLPETSHLSALLCITTTNGHLPTDSHCVRQCYV